MQSHSLCCLEWRRQDSSGIFRREGERDIDRGALGLAELRTLDPVADGVEMENGGLLR